MDLHTKHKYMDLSFRESARKGIYHEPSVICVGWGQGWKDK